MVNPVEWVRLDVVLQLAAGVSRCADQRELRVGEPLVLGGHLFQAASVGGDQPVQAWPASAGLAPFGSPVIWAGAVPVVEELGAHLLRLVPDGSAPYCGVSLLLRVRAHWVWTAARLACWPCDLVLGQQRVEVSAAGVPEIGVQPVSEQAASEEVPCEPVSVVVLRVFAPLFSGAHRPEVLQVLQERRALQAVAGAKLQHGWVLLEQEPVSVVLA